MRLRHVPGCEDFVASSKYTLDENKSFDIFNIFCNNNPLHVEIGMGKGKFIRELSQRNKDINYIGIEKYPTVLMKAIKRLDEDVEYNNLRFLCLDALKLVDIIGNNKVDTIYLNFSDPWPKKCYAKRRLTSEVFLKIYEKLLTHSGKVEFKTDNIDLFEFSLDSIKQNNWNLLYCSYDLHNDKNVVDNIMTEYEKKFSEKGNKIYKLIATPFGKKL